MCKLCNFVKFLSFKITKLFPFFFPQGCKILFQTGLHWPIATMPAAPKARVVRPHSAEEARCNRAVIQCAEDASYALQVCRMSTNSKCAGVFKK